jgi:hypothetical protein
MARKPYLEHCEHCERYHAVAGECTKEPEECDGCRYVLKLQGVAQFG